MDNTPLSPWGYFFRQIIYSIPVIGLIVLLIHAFGASNINAKNFARSFFCIYVVIIVLAVIMFAFGLGADMLDAIMNSIQN